MRKIEKGHYGYIRARKKTLLIRTMILFLGVIILLAMGFALTHTKKNLLTVAAIVSVLPAANQAVVLFALLPYHGREKEEYESVRAIVPNGVLNTELILTSKNDRSMPIDYAYVHPTGLYCFSFDSKLDIPKTEQYIRTMMKTNHLNTHVKIFRDFKQFKKRLGELEPIDRNTCEEKLLKIEGVLRAISI
ncbi:hypothetical protein NDGK_01176 [Clostridiales bacterium CHKCI001]|nr:hypothetical protein NDGK_01176 [Clostridiales bacterium CHKCI001]